MDLKFVDFCINFYNNSLDEDDKARLDFFRRLWEARNKAYEEVASEIDPYNEPDADAISTAYKSGNPVFRLEAPHVPLEQMAEVASSITGFIAQEGMFDTEVTEELSNLDWADAFSYDPPENAAKDVEGWLDRFADGVAAAGTSEQASHLAALIASLSLRAFYEEPASQAISAVKSDQSAIDSHPLRCPVCGSSPSVASVGGETSSDGRGRRLFCQQCGTPWEFDRVRCARCGTRDQTKLHFFNIEGDDSHRIATCDECGNYIRVTYIDDKLQPICFDVEDVVMGRLDAIAQDPRFMKDEDA